MHIRFVSIKYVRYADDFLVSVIGPYKLAVQSKGELSTYLYEEHILNLIMGKTLITKANNKPDQFIGTLISCNKVSDKKLTLNKTMDKTMITAMIYLKAPVDKIINKLIVSKFAKWNPNGTKIIPIGLKRIQNLYHAHIIAYYNAVVRGIVNYYIK